MTKTSTKDSEKKLLSLVHGPCGAFPLTAANCGERLKIVRLLGGRTFQCRMASLGLCPGQEIELSTNNGSGPGPRIVTTNAGRFALGCGMCHKILVAPWEDRKAESTKAK